MKFYFKYSEYKYLFISMILIFFCIKSDAQIIYTDLVPDSVIDTNGEIFHLDLNNNGNTEFNLKLTRANTYSPICGTYAIRWSITASPFDPIYQAIANRDYSGVNYASAIAADTIINDTNFIWNSNLDQNLIGVNPICSGTKSSHHWTSAVTGKWVGAVDKFLGLKFRVGSYTFYGWVRISLGLSGSFIVKDYAYNSVPDQLIFAGQTTSDFLSTSAISGSPFCIRDSLNIGYTIYGNFDSTNVFTAQLSDSSGSFANPVTIGIKPGNVSGTINAIIPVWAADGLLYHIRVVASNPVRVSNYINTNLIINTTLPVNHISTTDSSVICEGDSSRLIAVTNSSNSYQWSLNNLNINNATKYFYFADTIGTYRCMITNGCGSILSDSIVTSLLPSPVATITTSGPLWICPGQSVTLYVDSTPGYSYIWYQNSISVGTQSEYLVNQTGRYFVRVVDSSGCWKNSMTDTVQISNPSAYIAAVGSLSFCAGDSVMLSLTSFVDTSFTFQWYYNNNQIPGEVSKTYYAKLSGTYKIKVAIPNGNCNSSSNVLTVNAVCAGEETIASNKTHFILGPNPSNHFIEINGQMGKTINVQIINHLGQIIYNEKINSAQKIIDVSNFSDGIYFIKCIEKDYSESKQFSVAN